MASTEEVEIGQKTTCTITRPGTIGFQEGHYLANRCLISSVKNKSIIVLLFALGAILVLAHHRLRGLSGSPDNSSDARP